MKAWLILLALLLVGCAGIPTSRDVTTTLSTDMVVRGCVVETYVSVNGISDSGERYDRYGKVFYFPDRNALAYNPNFGWITGAISFLSLGSILPGQEGERYVKVLPTKKGWQVFLVQGERLYLTGIVSKDKQKAVEIGAVFLQTGEELGRCKDGVQFR